MQEQPSTTAPSRFPTPEDIAAVLEGVRSITKRPSATELYAILVGLANACVDNHQPAKALAFAAAAQAVNPAEPHAYNAAGRAHFSVKAYLQAVDYFEAALRINRSPVYVNNLEPIAKLYTSEPEFWTVARAAAPNKTAVILEQLPPERKSVVLDYMASERAKRLLALVKKNAPFPTAPVS